MMYSQIVPQVIFKNIEITLEIEKKKFSKLFPKKCMCKCDF